MLTVELLLLKKSTKWTQRTLFKGKKRNGGCQLQRYQSVVWVKHQGNYCITKGMPLVKSSKQPWQLIPRFCLKWRFHTSTWILFRRWLSSLALSISPVWFMSLIEHLVLFYFREVRALLCLVKNVSNLVRSLSHYF